MAFVVTGLSDYVKNNRELFLKDLIIGANSIQRATIQPGVKKSAAVNLLNVVPVLQSGSSCGWNASGNATFSERIITTGDIKINMSFCKKDLLGKWTEYVVRYGADNNEFPFEQYIMDEVRDGIKEQMETAVWQFDTSNSDLFDGWLKIINAASGTIKVNIASGKSAYEAVRAVYDAIPQKILKKKDLAINVSPVIFRAFCKEITDANLYHYTADDNDRVLLPGTNCPVVCVEGLADSVGTNYRKIVATFDKNLIYGTDMLEDAEELKAWYSEDNDEHRLKANWNSGCQIAFPDLCVLGTMAADPVSPDGTQGSLAKIATNTANLAGIKSNTAPLGDIKTAAETIATNTGNLADIKTNTGTIGTNTGELADANHVFKTKEQA